MTHGQDQDHFDDGKPSFLIRTPFWKSRTIRNRLHRFQFHIMEIRLSIFRDGKGTDTLSTASTTGHPNVSIPNNSWPHNPAKHLPILPSPPFCLNILFRRHEDVIDIYLDRSSYFSNKERSVMGPAFDKHMVWFSMNRFS